MVILYIYSYDVSAYGVWEHRLKSYKHSFRYDQCRYLLCEATRTLLRCQCNCYTGKQAELYFFGFERECVVCMYVNGGIHFSICI